MGEKRKRGESVVLKEKREKEREEGERMWWGG